MLSHASILVAGGSTAQAITAAAVKLTAFTANGDAASSDAGDQSATPDAANDRLLLRPGRYFVCFDGAGETAAATATWTLHLRLNGRPVALGCSFKTTTSGNPDVHPRFAGIIEIETTDLNASGVCPVELYGSANGDNLTLRWAQLTAIAIDPLAHGGIQLFGGSTGQPLQDYSNRLRCFSDNAVHSSFSQGDQAIEPDVVHDRLLLGLGSYLVRFTGSGEIEQDVGSHGFALRKNGTDTRVGLDLETVSGSSTEVTVGFTGIVRVTAADLDGDGVCVLDVGLDTDANDSSQSSSSSSNSSSSSSNSSSSNSSSSSSNSSSSSSLQSQSSSSSGSSSSSDSGPTLTLRHAQLTALQVA